MAIVLNGHEASQMAINGRLIESGYINGRRVFPSYTGSPLDMIRNLKWEIVGDRYEKIYGNGSGDFIIHNTETDDLHVYIKGSKQWISTNVFKEINNLHKIVGSNNGYYFSTVSVKTGMHYPSPTDATYIYMSKDGLVWAKFPDAFYASNTADFGTRKVYTAATRNGKEVSFSDSVIYVTQSPHIYSISDFYTSQYFYSTNYNGKNTANLVYCYDKYIAEAFDSIYSSLDGKKWTIVGDFSAINRFSDIKVVNNKCFIGSYDNDSGVSTLYMFGDDNKIYHLFNENTSSLYSNKLTYCSKNKAYLYFGHSYWYGSYNLLDWEILKNPISDNVYFDNCEYVPGDGFYLKASYDVGFYRASLN